MYFGAVLLRLKVLNAIQKLSAADGAYAHAAILNKITDVSIEAGQKLHDLPRHKPLSLGIIQSTKQVATVRLTFMAEDGLTYTSTLINALSIQPMLQLGRATCSVETVDLTNPEWCGFSTWADFVSSKSDAHLCFHFVTPTAITKRDPDGGRFVSLYPEPLDIFAGLTRRWQALSGPTLPEGLERFITTGGCVISRYKLQTEGFIAKERVQIGFTGQAVFECRKKEAEYIAALNALARFAYFAGIGYQTMRGLGTVQVSSY